MQRVRPFSKPGGDATSGSQNGPTTPLRKLAIGALLASCTALAACGGQQTSSTSSSAYAVASAPASSAGQRPPSRAQALAFAHAVNLTAADIPEASLAPRETNLSNAREQREVRACLRSVQQGHTLAHATSPKLKRGHELEVEEIRSSVDVMSGERAIATEFAGVERAGVLECVAHVLTRNYADKAIRDARWGRFTISKLTLALPGVKVTIGIRVVATLNLAYSEVSVPIYVDLLGFADGPAEVLLSTASVTQPMPAATEQEILELLLTRARAHSL